MKDWRSRKAFHRDGNQVCIKLTDHYSVAFDVFLFKIFFSTLFKLPGKNRIACGSMWWKTLSLKKKIFSKTEGLAKFLCFYIQHEKRPYHGINWYHVQLSFLLIYFNYYFDEKLNDLSVVDTCVSVKNL